MHWAAITGIAIGSTLLVIVVALCICSCYEARTEYIFSANTQNSMIKEMLVERPYKPTLYLPTAWLKMYAWLKKKVSFTFKRETLKLSDGGQIYLDYYPSNFEDLDWPILVIIPGLNGGSGESYVGYTALEAQKKKFRSVIYNRRGFEGIELTGKHMLSWARIDDFDEVLNEIRKKSPSSSNMYSIGFSMGSNYTQFYLGEKGKNGENVQITASVTVSPPHNLAKGSHKIDASTLVRKALLKSCMEIILVHKDSEVLKRAIEEKGLNIKELSEVKTLRELDTKFTAKMLDLNHCDEYYNAISGSYRIEHISIPVLSISSRFDPVVEHSGLETDKVMANANIFQAVINNGGHIEYPHGWSNRNWAVDVGLDYLTLVDQGKIAAL